VEDYLIQRRGFWFTLSVVLKPSLLALPCVAREHTQGAIVKCRGEVAWLGGYQGYCARSDRMMDEDIVAVAPSSGVGGAVLAGYRRAIACGAGVIVKLDGDGQMNPDLIR